MSVLSCNNDGSFMDIKIMVKLYQLYSFITNRCVRTSNSELTSISTQ